MIFALLLAAPIGNALVFGPSPLRLLTFDLDDTLYPCGRVVQKANAVLRAKLIEHGAVDVPDNLQESIRDVRSAHEAAGGERLRYTELRCRAIANLLNTNTADSIVNRCFDTWLKARQAAADELLYKGVVDALKAVRKSYPHCIVGAVTNGRGDPRDMPRLAGLFDFCVCGEDIDVWPESKPSQIIFQKTICRAVDSSTDAVDGSALQANWVHVGDCLVNDVAASKKAGASTVWFDSSHDPLSTFSTASPEETERRRVERENALSAGYVDQRIEEMSALPKALAAIGEASLQT